MRQRLRYKEARMVRVRDHGWVRHVSITLGTQRKFSRRLRGAWVKRQSRKLGSVYTGLVKRSSPSLSVWGEWNQTKTHPPPTTGLTPCSWCSPTEILNTNGYSPDPKAGANGSPVQIPSYDMARMQKLYHINRFNLLASDRIPVNRTLPDIRKKKWVLPGRVYWLICLRVSVI